MIDLKKIKLEQTKDIIHPVKIFAALLNKNAKYNGYLRNVQSEVLNKWFELRNNRENIIKMNTGSGKTTVSLLILQSCLNEKKGNAIYVVPDNYLIEQVITEANDLGIKVTTDVDSIDFLTNKAILIITIQKLINGKSIFSRKKISNILIDDVHACLEIATNQFKILINRNENNKLYNEILSLFKLELQSQNYHNFLNIESGEILSDSMLVPFWAVQDKYKELLNIINNHRNAENFTNIEFPLELIGDIIDMCNIVITFDQIEITPDCIPIQKISGFDNANRRIYVSATLKDDGSLIKNFNLDINDLNEIITPEDALDIGNRIILFPQINNPKITDDEIKEYLHKKSSELRVVVIVPSKKRAEFWRDCADRIFDKNNIHDIKNYDKGLDVIINRYNGIDLKDDLCRILVIDGLPNARTKYEEIREMMFLDTIQSVKEQMQKIEQGMGRGIRSNQDYCAVIFMQKSLSNIIYYDGAKNNFGISTLKQFELSESFYEDLSGKNLNEILDNIDLCIKRDKEWLELTNDFLSDIKYINSINYDEKDLIQNKAYQYGLNRDYKKCAEEIQKNVNNETNLKLRGYYKMMLAKYTNYFDKEAAQKILKSAKEDNRFVILPLGGFSYKKNNKKITNQSKQLIKYLKDNYNTEKDYLLKMNSIINNLVFAPKTSNKFELAMCELADHLGFMGEMPEQQFGIGPDVLWKLGNNSFFVIECKNEAFCDEISKSDCGQLLNSMNWAEKTYENSDILGIIVHKSNKFSSTASPNGKTRILSQEKLEFLIDNVKNFISAFENLSFDEINDEKIKNILNTNNLDINSITNKYLTK